MAPTQAIINAVHEFWTELVPQIGGAAQTVLTSIPYRGAADEPYVDSLLTLVTVTGNPAFTITYAASANFTLNVTITNTAGGGAANQSTWTLDLRYPCPQGRFKTAMSL